MNRPHKQSMSELKLRRLTEHNARLREDLARPRIRVSEAAARCVVVFFFSHVSWKLLSLIHPLLLLHGSLIRYCKTTKDHLVRTTLQAVCLTCCTSADGLYHCTGTFGLGASEQA